MATTTYIELGGASLTQRFKAALGRAFARMVAAREREARRHVAMHLSMLDDATLARTGWTRADVNALEKTTTYY